MVSNTILYGGIAEVSVTLNLVSNQCSTGCTPHSTPEFLSHFSLVIASSKSTSFVFPSQTKIAITLSLALSISGKCREVSNWS